VAKARSPGTSRSSSRSTWFRSATTAGSTSSTTSGASTGGVAVRAHRIGTVVSLRSKPASAMAAATAGSADHSEKLDRSPYTATAPATAEGVRTAALSSTG
jgi:hypothetical protein